MSLYEGIDVDNVSEQKEKNQWPSQIKFLQSQLHLKKTVQVTQKAKFGKAINFPKDTSDSIFVQDEPIPPELNNPLTEENDDSDSTGLLVIKNEYDPRYPNDYDKIMVFREEEKERERADDWKKEIEERERRRRERYDRNARGGRDDGPAPSLMPRRNTEDDEADEYKGRNADDNDPTSARKNKMAAIAPPLSVLRDVDAVIAPGGASNASKIGFAPSLENSVAARIMAKYGFREGQGLGKSEQGMSQPLQVEKTSKRGGKILHEKDLTIVKGNKGADTNQFASNQDDPSLSPSLTFDDNTTLIEPADDEEDRVPVPSALSSLYNDEEGEGNDQGASTSNSSQFGRGFYPEGTTEPNAPPVSTFLNDPPVFKTPSKVVLLRNMVGPGEVDADLEDETREECTKYGEVRSCVVFEILPDVEGGSAAHQIPETERVRIFVEFARVESAIKAVVDLNNRFFGGRLVSADFYNLDKFKMNELGEGL